MKNFFSIDVDSKRVFGLDLLRAFAIFCVMQGHAGVFLNETSLEWLTCIPIPHGVDIFFIISGFLIGKSFISHLEKNENSIGRKKILTFYARTALRILPNYFFILVVNYLLVTQQVIPGNTKTFPLWRFITLTHNITTPFWDFYWESWSLSVQWWFYILFPLLLMVLSLFAKPKKYIPWLCVFFVVLSMAFRLSAENEVIDGFRWDIWLRKTAMSRIDNIFIGVLAVWVMHYFREWWDRYAGVSLIAGLALFYVLHVIPHDIGSLYYDVLYLTLSAVAIALWMPIFTKMKKYKTIVGGFISRISILSYSMFLTNLCVVVVMRNVFEEFTLMHGKAAYLIFWPVVLVVSYLLHIFVEKPFMRVRERI